METLDDSSATQPVKSPEANLAAPKGFLLKFNNTPEVTKKSVYIGNLPWWCTDSQLAHACVNLGAKDLRGIRFYENRLNGQSKGYALVEFGSEVSCHIVANKLPLHVLLDQHPTAALTSKIGLAQFEQFMKKGQSAILEEVNKSSYTGRPRVPTKQEERPRPRPPFPPSVPPGPPVRMGGPPVGGPFPPMGGPPGMPGPWMGPGPGMPPPMPPDMMHPRAMHPPLPPFHGPPDMVMGGPLPHVNPNFFPDQRLHRPNEPFGGHGPPGADKGFGGQVDFAEVMKRNHAVSSTALVRAVQDANSGDYESAVNTLNTAISLISQSAAASSESSQALIQNLKDCLEGIKKGKAGSPAIKLSPGLAGSSSGSRSPSPSFRRNRSRSRGRRDDRERDVKGGRRPGGGGGGGSRERGRERERYSRLHKEDDYRRSRRK
ncbi:cleavage and polyadenylation specificity factor subunit 6-like isoform X2 [Oscarella lobularis]